MFLSFPIVILAACVVLAYRYAEMENLSGALWALLSLVLWLAPEALLGAGFLVLLGLQIGLLVAIRVVAVRRNGC